MCANNVLIYSAIVGVVAFLALALIGHVCRPNWQAEFNPILVNRTHDTGLPGTLRYAMEQIASGQFVAGATIVIQPSVLYTKNVFDLRACWPSSVPTNHRLLEIRLSDAEKQQLANSQPLWNTDDTPFDVMLIKDTRPIVKWLRRLEKHFLKDVPTKRVKCADKLHTGWCDQKQHTFVDVFIKWTRLAGDHVTVVYCSDISHSDE